MLPGRWKDPDKPDQKNTELEAAMKMISIADKDTYPLTDTDPHIKKERYNADKYQWQDRGREKPVERTFLKAKRRCQSKY